VERRAGGGDEDSISAKVGVEGSGVGELSELKPHFKWLFATRKMAVSLQ